MTPDGPPGELPTRILNIAHRGASASVPENTLAAVRRAIASGADLVELDVQRSKDGALVVLHDATLLRTTNAQSVFPDRAPWQVGDFTHRELMRLDAGSRKSPDFADERIPTLEQAIDVLHRSSAGLLLEVKTPGRYPGIVADVAAALTAVPGYTSSAIAQGKLTVQSFDFAAMKEMKTRQPMLPVGLLGTPPLANLPALASWAAQVNPQHLSVNRAYVDHVHRLGMSCFVWTINREHAIKRALRMGVDGVITNRPEVLDRMLGADRRAPNSRADWQTAQPWADGGIG